MADPGFPVGAPSRWGHQPPMWVLFGKNTCENERFGSHWGGGGDAPWIRQWVTLQIKDKNDIGICKRPSRFATMTGLAPVEGST